MIPWTEKYRPRTLKDFLGQEDAKYFVKEFINNFKSQRKKALLFFGGPGTGKTSFVYALASDLDLEILEMNASDFRNKQQIHDIVGKALEQKSLFGKGKIIFVDELEGISGTKDRGGLQELIRLIDKAKHPVILACNDPWLQKLRSLRTKVQKIEFKELDVFTFMKLISRVVKKEKITISDLALKKLSEASKGDVRAAINDLQALASVSNSITVKDIGTLDFREKEEAVFKAIQRVLKTRDARGAFDAVDLDLDKIFLWLDENLPLDYYGKELERAYEKLSLADLFRRRIIRRQHWRFLAYIYDLVTQGIAVSKQREKEGFTRYKPPTRILKLWIMKQKLAKKRAIAMKLAKQSHCSIKQAMRDLDILKKGLQENHDIQQQFVDYLSLQEESEWFLK